MLHQKKNKAEAYYFHVFTSEYSYNRQVFFKAIIYICEPGTIYGGKRQLYSYLSPWKGAL